MKVDKQQAVEILTKELEKYRAMGYVRLAELVGEEIVFVAAGQDGVEYQIEIDVIWDDPRRPGGTLRVLAAIDDGRFPAAFAPLMEDFLVEPDG
jgi:hypothetical protein